MRRLRGPRSLQFEVVLNLAGVLTAGLATVAVVCVGLAARTIEREAVDRLRLTAHHIQRVAARDAARLSDLAALARTIDNGGLGGFWRVFDRAGREAWSGPRAEPRGGVAGMIEEAWAVGEAVRGGLFPYADLRLAIPLRTVRGEEGALIGTVAAAHLWHRIRSLLGATLWVLGITSVVFVGFGAYTLRRRIVNPVREIALASARIAEGCLSTRVDVPGASELSQLGEHFNRMAGSLEGQRQALIEAERSLARSERLASVGRLAAGVAHEVGNPVAAILGFVEVARREGGLSHRAADALQAVRAEALRVRTLIREMLDLARASDVVPGPHAVAELLEPPVARMRMHPATGGVEIVLSRVAGLPRVRTDPRRAEQILVNLIENAVHAVRGVEGGRVEVSARSLEPLADASGAAAPPPPGYVALDVTDNGPGIEPADLSRVFDPFYTTKDPGEGTGLGLWNAHRLAELLEGKVEVESRPGRTRFSLILPATDSVEQDEPTAHSDHR